MKKVLLSLIAVAGLAFTTQAQTEKGNFLIGGNVELNTGKTDGAAKTNINFAVIPSVGYFFSNDFAVGTGIGYEYAKNYSSVDVAGTLVGASAQSSAFVVSPFLRGYKSVNDQFKFFAQLSVPMAFGNNKIGDAEGNNMVKTGKNNQVGVALSPGFAFFPSKKFGIEFSVNGISYNDYNAEDANGNNVGGNKNFNIGANFFAPKIGVQFYL
ncbi:outer membrane beta-barrel protein [Pedobacter sp. MR2016-24]|uniref:outer membrane beta-barrel protein n=1 Tax=Pedobacter sp. MR2016-24 TaxID=2994466 RepID=UPI00224627D6|nr:outer membrane beta-barrel protein [Pedobacter sp. MR2016-24]MCX2483008.1 outer membrane beta-barrel protein [Pedobacter sp. MR2016-24]